MLGVVHPHPGPGRPGLAAHERAAEHPAGGRQRPDGRAGAQHAGLGLVQRELQALGAHGGEAPGPLPGRQPLGRDAEAAQRGQRPLLPAGGRPPRGEAQHAGRDQQLLSALALQLPPAAERPPSELRVPAPRPVGAAQNAGLGRGRALLAGPVGVGNGHPVAAEGEFTGDREADHPRPDDQRGAQRSRPLTGPSPWPPDRRAAGGRRWSRPVPRPRPPAGAGPSSGPARCAPAPARAARRTPA